MQGAKKVSGEVIKGSIFPIIVFLIVLVGYIFYRINISPLLSPEAEVSLHKYIVTAFIFCVTFLLQRVSGSFLNWYKENIAEKTATELDDELIPLLRRTAKIAIWVIALLIILPFYGVNITALVAALGVTSLAIALAAQDTIANVIAGFLIMIDRPFRLGDRIKLPSGELVKVLSIGVRRSTFVSDESAIIIVPNSNLSKSKIVNYTYGKEQLTERVVYTHSKSRS